MIGDYVVVAVVFGIVVSYVAILHRVWLRDAFKEEIGKSVSATNTNTNEIPTSRPPRSVHSGQLPQTPAPDRA